MFHKGPMIFLQLKLAWVVLGAAFASASAAVAQTLPGCEDRCGNISIPYPFGTTEACRLADEFQVTCNNTHHSSPKLYLNTTESDIEITGIFLSGELRILAWIGYDCFSKGGVSETYNPSLTLSKFPISNTRNKFTAVGCDTLAVVKGFLGRNYTTGCLSLCDTIDSVINGSCSGIGCCQTNIPKGVKNYQISLSSYNNHTSVRGFNPCSYAFVAEETAYNFSSSDLNNLQGREKLPVVFDWAVGGQTCHEAIQNPTSYACKDKNSSCTNFDNGPGYRCNCLEGYEGNPYIPNGCRGLISGIAVLLLIIASWWLYKVQKKRNKKKQKENFFKRNGGLLLKEKLSSSSCDGSVEKTKLFRSKELEKATDHYNKDRILGQGGQGTVYKGMLSDGSVVAIKKSKIVDEGNVGQFINEVVILSQINHRNVVKLLGCCLETEVPLVVYELISNGTLFEHIHDANEDFPLPWEMRLRIATEIAGALSYLHSAASVPIYHRDIKSTNILLDDKYRAKVSDFGSSRSVAIDQTHFTTQVQGTFGYLDPEYFQSSQFTEKSDVYSLGVVIVELLTGQKAISSNRSQERRSLATFFIQSMEDNHLYEIIDQKIIKEDWREEIVAVAHLAKRCLNLNGKKRPTMKDVAVELEGIRMLRGNTVTQQNYEVFDYNRTDLNEAWDATSTSTGACFDVTAASSSDVKPLLLNEP